MSSPVHDLLADDAASLKAIIAHERSSKADAASMRDAEIERLRLQVRLLLAQGFGAKSERVSEESPQLGLFSEAEAEVDNAAATEDDAEAAVTTVAAHTRQRGHSRPLATHLAREDVLHDLPESEKVCPHDGTALTLMGEATSERLDIIPAQIRVPPRQNSCHRLPLVWVEAGGAR